MLTDLGDLIAAYHVESARWPDLRAMLIWEQAWTLDRVRIDVARGTIPIEHGRDWLTAGRTVLDSIRAERSVAK